MFGGGFFPYPDSLIPNPFLPRPSPSGLGAEQVADLVVEVEHADLVVEVPGDVFEHDDAGAGGRVIQVGGDEARQGAAVAVFDHAARVVNLEAVAVTHLTPPGVGPGGVHGGHQLVGACPEQFAAVQ